MAEKSAKKKTKKGAKAETGVLGNLSATRPTRLGGDRRGATTRPARATAATSSRPTAAMSSRPTAAMSSRATAATSSRPTAATSSRGAAKQPAAAKSSAKPKAAKPEVRTTAGTPPTPPSAPPAGWQTPGQDGRKSGPPSGTEIVSTAVQAAGEIAQLGITVGGQILKRAAGRIPRP